MNIGNQRILIVDDQENMHADYRKILSGDLPSLSALEAAEQVLFDEAVVSVEKKEYNLSHAYGGQDGLALVKGALDEGKPYCLAFVDGRMPPGWDGIETIERLWEADPDLQVVLCTAYSDYSYEEIVGRLGNPDKFLILKKPFDTIEVQQLAEAITEKWRLMKESKRYTDDLECRVKRRTDELHTANLQLKVESRRANLLAEKAQEMSRLKSEFLSMMSHEIRTPLNGALGMMQLILGTKLSDEQRDYANTAFTCGEKLLGSLNDLLDLINLEANRVALSPVEFDLPSLVQRTLDAHGPAAADKGLKICTSLENLSHRWFCGDENLLGQVLSILVSNAIKFTDEGEVRVEVGVSKKIGLSRVVRFEVSDTGRGIREEVQKRLFKPFVQADSSDTREFDGLGLGLAIGRKLVELMRGEIGVESKWGKGSRFCFEVRLERAAKGATSERGKVSGSETPPARQESGHASSEAGAKVLVAEDNPFNSKVLMKLLKRLGVQADLAKNGIEAVDLWQKQRHPLIIMDCQMPEMDGFEATRRIREFEAQRGIPRTRIVACTASSNGASRQACHDIGMDDSLPKPIKLPQLEESLRHSGILRN